MDNELLVRETWAAISGGDLSGLEALLAPDAKWRAVEDGPWNCQSRDAILERMRANHEQRGLSGSIEGVTDFGDRVMVVFRPDLEPGQEWDEPWPLSDGVRYHVVTLRDGLIVEMKGCADRKIALAYAEAES